MKKTLLFWQVIIYSHKQESLLLAEVGILSASLYPSLIKDLQLWKGTGNSRPITFAEDDLELDLCRV